jgi:hypothetical protein
VPLPPEEMSDRFEIQDLVVAYSHAVDSRAWDALDDVFTPDASIDFSEMGGPSGGLAETKAFLRGALAAFSSSQHLVGVPAVRLEGDEARGRTTCHNPMVFDDGRILLAGLWYRDTFVRTPQGWRIRERAIERSYLRVLPAD